jgi:hypothetical protein
MWAHSVLCASSHCLGGESMSFIMYYYSSPCVSSLLFNLYSIIIILFSSFSPQKNYFEVHYGCWKSFFVTGNGSVYVFSSTSRQKIQLFIKDFLILSCLWFEVKGVHWISHTTRVIFCHAFGFCRQVSLVPLLYPLVDEACYGHCNSSTAKLTEGDEYLGRTYMYLWESI